MYSNLAASCSLRQCATLVKQLVAQASVVSAGRNQLPISQAASGTQRLCMTATELT